MSASFNPGGWFLFFLLLPLFAGVFEFFWTVVPFGACFLTALFFSWVGVFIIAIEAREAGFFFEAIRMAVIVWAGEVVIFFVCLLFLMFLSEEFVPIPS